MKRVLVTTVKRGAVVEDSGAVYVYDFDANAITNQIGMLPLKARFVRNPRGGIRGLRGSCIDSDKKIIYVASNDTITALDYDLNMLYTIESPLFCNLHEIRLYDKYILVASCGNDRVLHVDQNGLVQVLWCESSLRASDNLSYAGIDSHGEMRPNSIFFYKGSNYVSFAADNRICKIINQGILEDAVPRPYVDTPHSLFIDDDKFYWHNSGNRELVCYDHGIVSSEYKTIFVDDDTRLFKKLSPITRWGWLRGLDIYKGHIIQGSSPYGRIIYRDTDTFEAKQVQLSKDLDEAVYSTTFFKEDWS